MIRLDKRTNLASRITDRIFEAILEGELKPGERIIETKMAKQLGVGQSTFREALQALEARGLVTKSHGTFVTKLTEVEAQILFAVRLELEPLAASLACASLTSTHIRQLELHLDEMKAARHRRDFIALLKNDLAFHQLIWEIPAVGTLSRILDLVLAPLFAFFFMRNSRAFSDDPALAEETFRDEHAEHCKLLAVLKAGKPSEVRKTFREVTQSFAQTIVDLSGATSSMLSSQAPWRASERVGS